MFAIVYVITNLYRSERVTIKEREKMSLDEEREEEKKKKIMEERKRTSRKVTF